MAANRQALVALAVVVAVVAENAVTRSSDTDWNLVAAASVVFALLCSSPAAFASTPRRYRVGATVVALFLSVASVVGIITGNLYAVPAAVLAWLTTVSVRQAVNAGRMLSSCRRSKSDLPASPETPFLGMIWIMGRPSKYPRELRERAVRMVAEVRVDHDCEWAAMEHVARLLGVGSTETIRHGVRRAEIDGGRRPGVTTDAAAELARLRRENAELRRANEMPVESADLEGGCGFLRGRARPARGTVIAFVREHKDQRILGPDGVQGLRWASSPSALC